MENVVWQDIVLALGNLVFAVALLPSIFSRDKPALTTSLLTASMLTIFVATFSSLDLWLSALGVSVGAVGWWVLFVQKLLASRA